MKEHWEQEAIRKFFEWIDLREKKECECRKRELQSCKAQLTAYLIFAKNGMKLEDK